MKYFTKGTIVLALGLAYAGVAPATILTFDVDGIFPGLDMIQAYGDNVTGATDAVGSYGVGAEGYTGNVTVSYGTADPALWTTGYSDLTNVFYDDADGQGPLEILLTADASHTVQLYEFDLGSWLSDSIVPVISVLDEGNNVLFLSTSFPILGAGRTNFEFTTLISGQSLRIVIDQANLGGNSDNVGIDNVRFGQERRTNPIPEPTTLALLGLGLAGLVLRGRRTRA